MIIDMLVDAVMRGVMKYNRTNHGRELYGTPRQGSGRSKKYVEYEEENFLCRNTLRFLVRVFLMKIRSVMKWLYF